MSYEKFKEGLVMILQNLPDWAQDQEITLIAGLELLVHKMPGQPAEIKRVRCNYCGACCMDYPMTDYGIDDEGKCEKLEKEGDKWICRAGVKKPFNCLQDPLKSNDPDCVIEHDLINIE